MATRSASAPFSEKEFYRSEFRGRSIAIAARGGEIEDAEPLRELLGELESNPTRVVLLSDDRERVEALTGAPAVSLRHARFEGEVWRGFARGSSHVGVLLEDGAALPRSCHDAVLRLGLAKLMWVEREGGLRRPDGSRASFVDLEQLRRLLDGGSLRASEARVELLQEIEKALTAGLAAVNLCTLDGLGDELFSYAGSGTLFSRERYVEVRRLGLDDYDAAHDLVARGVAEGYLAPRPAAEVERVLVNAFGAFVEGRHLAGIGALLEHRPGGAAEIASLYTLTRFLGEGVGAHLIRFALERARDRGFGYVFACTASERVTGFFERQGFRRVSSAEVPAEKWQGYDPDRRAKVKCLRHDLRQG